MSKQSTKTDIAIYWRLLSYVSTSWPLFLVSFLGFLAYSGAQVLAADLMQFIVDSLGNEQPEAAGMVSSVALSFIESSDDKNPVFVAIALSFVVIAVLRGFGFFFGNYFLAKVGLGIIHQLRASVFNKMTTLPSTHFDEFNSGDLLAKITFHCNQVTDAATNAIKVVLQEGLVVLGIIIYMLVLNWKLTLLFIAILPIIAAFASWVGKQFRRVSRKIQQSVGDFTQSANEAIVGRREMRLFGGEHYERNRFLQRSDENFKQNTKLQFYSSIASPVSLFFVSLSLAVLIYLALRVSDQGTAGQFVSFISAAAIITRPVRQLTQVLAIIQKGLAACEDLFEFLDLPSEEETGSHTVDRVQGDIAFESLGFGYREGQKVIEDISFVVKPGETCALVGLSGSGKSTIVSLLARFYEYQQGLISIDGTPITSYTRSSLRKQMAIVSQQVTLFNDTIFNNVAYGELANKPREDVLRAIELANASEFVDDLPQGVDTVLGEQGQGLSGGQRQRLAIARAILKDAPILVLDEATSALDNRSEALIQSALDKVMQTRTSIVIAHRLSTIENADKIIVLDKGRIAEQGTHSELLAKGVLYKQLYEKNFED